MGVFDKVFGTHSERELKRIDKTVDKIESLQPAMQALSDGELRAKTAEFKKRFEEGETLDDIFAIRTPLYQKYADITVKADEFTIEETVTKLTELLK